MDPSGYMLMKPEMTAVGCRNLGGLLPLSATRAQGKMTHFCRVARLHFCASRVTDSRPAAAASRKIGASFLQLFPGRVAQTSPTTEDVGFSTAASAGRGLRVGRKALERPY